MKTAKELREEFSNPEKLHLAKEEKEFENNLNTVYYKHILRAAEGGLTEVRIYSSWMSERLIKTLEEKGFKVTVSDSKVNYIIDWNEE